MNIETLLFVYYQEKLVEEVANVHVFNKFPLIRKWSGGFAGGALKHFAFREHRKQSCEKEFPSYANLTPGLYLLTRGCKFKFVYGFSMMTTGESPSMLFNLVMTRFEDDYNPHIIYDASCLAKEYGYNRELKRFMSISITTDCFHEANHKTCSTSFRTSEYVKLMNVNSEACEQTNSALRKITSSTTFMSPSMYLRSLTLFLADMNLSNHKKK